MRELSTREKIIIGVVGLVALGFGFNQFLLEPHAGKVQKFRAELEELNKQTTSIGPKMVELNSLNANLTKKKQRVAELEQVFSYKAEPAEIINQVSRQAKNEGLQIQTIRPGRDIALRTKGGSIGEFRRLALDMGMRGRYEQLGEFLGELQQQPFYVRVDQLKVAKGADQPQLLEIRLSLEIVVRS